MIDPEQALVGAGDVGKSFEALIHTSSTPKGYDNEAQNLEDVAGRQCMSP